MWLRDPLEADHRTSRCRRLQTQVVHRVAEAIADLHVEHLGPEGGQSDRVRAVDLEPSPPTDRGHAVSPSCRTGSRTAYPTESCPTPRCSPTAPRPAPAARAAEPGPAASRT